MTSKKINFKAKMIEQNARRFPWGRSNAEELIAAVAQVVSASQELASICRDLPDHDEIDPDGWAVRGRRRMLRTAAECIGEVSDITNAIYSKFPDLAPEDLRAHYIA